MKNPLILLFLVIFSVSNSFGQSKKDQIEQLNYRVDSLIQILSSERTNIKQQKASLEQQIVDLNYSITKLNAQATKDNSLIILKELELSKVSSALSNLTSLLKVKSDSLNLVLADLEKLKPPVKVAPVIPVVDSIGPLKGVSIGTKTWSTKNLDVATFRNGDAIPEAKTNEEWSVAGENRQPAWCYYENKTANGTKYGKMYNWYAAIDARGLAPTGWHVPTDQEWAVLSTFLGGEAVAGKKMKSVSGWLENGNGTNSSGFLGHPGGGRGVFGNFDGAGIIGCWLSTSEYSGSAVWCWAILSSYPSLIRLDNPKYAGVSVRCVKD